LLLLFRRRNNFFIICHVAHRFSGFISRYFHITSAILFPQKIKPEKWKEFRHWIHSTQISCPWSGITSLPVKWLTFRHTHTPSTSTTTIGTMSDVIRHFVSSWRAHTHTDRHTTDKTLGATHTSHTGDKLFVCWLLRLKSPIQIITCQG
jgi:hypothetical protein